MYLKGALPKRYFLLTPLATVENRFYAGCPTCPALLVCCGSARFVTELVVCSSRVRLTAQRYESYRSVLGR